MLSVIIPVYNTEKYIKRCLETVVNQSYPDFEIIIINDASTDNSDKIIKNFITNYKNIKYYNLPENIGIGNARNLGISYASGEYIGFVDSDDWIDSDFYHKLINSVIEYNTDIGIAGIKTEYDNFQSSEIRYQYYCSNVIDNIFALHSLTNEYAHDIKISPIVNNKIYKKSIITENNLKFDKSRRSEDNSFSFLSLVYSKKISIISDTYYHYYQRPGSATHDFNKSYIDDYFYILTSIKEKLEEQNLYNKYRNEYISFINRCINGIFVTLFNNEQDNDIQKKYIAYIIEKCFTMISIQDLINYIDTGRFKKFFGL